MMFANSLLATSTKARDIVVFFFFFMIIVFIVGILALVTTLAIIVLQPNTAWTVGCFGIFKPKL